MPRYYVRTRVPSCACGIMQSSKYVGMHVTETETNLTVCPQLTGISVYLVMRAYTSTTATTR